MATKCRATEGCEKDGKKLGFCGTHYQQVKRGSRHFDGHLLRALRVTYVGTGLTCKVQECLRVPLALGFCSRHYQLLRFNRIDEQGSPTDPSVWKSFYNPNRKTPGTAGPCSIQACRMQRVDSATGFCGKHYQQLKHGIIDDKGVILREQYRVRRYTDADLCKVTGCGKKARSNFFCTSHAGQFSAGRIDFEGNRLTTPSRGRAPSGNARYIHTHGYVMVSAPANHPRASSDGYVLEHRLVMEKKLGRYLESYEIVHHRDGNRQNNAPDNLEVLTRKKHPTAHEHTEETVSQALEALRHNDPVAYNRLIGRHHRIGKHLN